MVGDSSCARIRQHTEDSIMCIDSDGKETGWRPAMTDQQLQMWQFNQQQQQQRQQVQQSAPRPTNTNCYRAFGGGINCYSY